MILTEVEKNALAKILSASKVRGPAIGSDKSPWRIRAELIRSLLLGLPVGDTVNELPRCGLRFENIIVDGRLDLDEMDGPQHDKLPSLTFKHCLLEGGFSANNTKLQSLRLHYSSFSVSDPDLAAICIDNAVIDGTCNFSNIGPTEPDQSCRISARNCEIIGSLLLTGSHLICPCRETLAVTASTRYALNLLNAKICGDFECKLGLWASGGVSLVKATICGNIWLLGSRLDAAEGWALNLQGTTCDGGLIIRPAVDSIDNSVHASYLNGGIHGFGASISDGVYIEGVSFGLHPYKEKLASTAVSVSFPKARIGHGVSIVHFQKTNISPLRSICECLVCFDDAYVDGNLSFLGVALNKGVALRRAKITGKLEISCSQGDILFETSMGNGFDLSNCHVGGDFLLYGAKIEGNLSAADANFLGNVVLSCLITPQNENNYIPFSVKHTNFQRSSIGGSLAINGSNIDGALLLKNCLVEGSIEVGASKFTADNVENVVNTNISGDINLQNAKVGRSQLINGVIVKGCFNANFINVGENVIFTSHKTQPEYWNMIGGQLSYENSMIAGTLSLCYLKVDTDRKPQLRGVSFNAANISKDVFVFFTDIWSSLTFLKANIGGELHINLPTEKDAFISHGVPAFNLQNIHVGKDLTLKASAEHIKLTAAIVHGSVRFTGEVKTFIQGQESRVGGSLELAEVVFKSTFSESDTQADEHSLKWSEADIGGVLSVKSKAYATRNKDFALKSWRRSLSCYPDFDYVETLFNRPDGSWIASFLVPKSFWKAPEEHSILLCNSYSAIFHTLNAANKLNIDNEENAREYIKLFCASVWGDNGAFSIIESADILPKEYVSERKKENFEWQDVVPMERLELDSILPKNDQKRIVGADDIYLFKVYMWHGDGLAEAYILLKRGGLVEMLTDVDILHFKNSFVPAILPPLLEFHDDFQKKSNFVSKHAEEMEVIEDEQADILHPAVTKALTQNLNGSGLGKVKVDLSNTTVSNLDDNAGQAWGPNVSLQLRHFTYQSFTVRTNTTKRGFFGKILYHMHWKMAGYRADTVRKFGQVLTSSSLSKLAQNGRKILQHPWAINPIKPRYSQQTKTRIKNRLQWLMKQFPERDKHPFALFFIRILNKLPFVNLAEKHRPVQYSLFSIQPFLQAANVFRREGVAELAREIDSVARYHAGYKNAANSGLMMLVRYPVHFLYGSISKFGLSPGRVFAFLLALIMFGGLMVEVANQQGVLVVRSAPLTGTIEQEQQKMLVVLNTSANKPNEQRTCGTRVEPMLYAADVFIPLINLGQYDHCVVSTGGLASAPHSAGTSVFSTLAQQLSTLVPKRLSFWRWSQALYALLGWIMLSLFIFTLTYRLSGYRSEKAD